MPSAPGDEPALPEDGSAPPVRSVPGLAAAMAVAMGAGPLIVYSISTLSPVLVRDLGLSSTQYGALATVNFLAAALASRQAGRVVDSTGVRLVMWWLILGAAGSVLAAAAAPGYAVLLVAVTASGVLTALSNPVTNRLAAQRVPLRHRGPVMGVKQSGVQMAQAATGLALPALAVLAGWRGAFAVIAGACLLLGALLVVRYVPAEPPHTGTRAVGTAGIPAAVWWLTAFLFLTGAALQGVNFYLPLYGYQRLDLALGTAGLLAAVVGVVGVLARIGWGTLSSRLSGTAALVTVSLGGAVSMTLILLAQHVHPNLVWAGAVLLGATGISANVVVMVDVLRVVGPQAIGRASGLVALGMYLGFAAGPVSVGAIVDAAGNYTWAWSGLIALYLLAAATAAGRAWAARLA